MVPIDTSIRAQKETLQPEIVYVPFFMKGNATFEEEDSPLFESALQASECLKHLEEIWAQPPLEPERKNSEGSSTTVDSGNFEEEKKRSDKEN